MDTMTGNNFFIQMLFEEIIFLRVNLSKKDFFFI